MKYLDVPSSGSIADRTHSHNRAGQYTRNRRAPVQPTGTGRRAIVRSNFATASAAWAGLTSTQQAGWDSFANEHPVTDSLGQSILLTGHQMFVRVYASAVNAGIAAPTGPISDLTLPAGTGLSVTADATAGIDAAWTESGSGGKYVFAVSQQVSPGRRFMKTFWQPFGSAGYAVESGESWNLPAATYSAQFGSLVAGRKVFVRITPVSSEGWNGTPTILQAVVTSL